MQNNRERALYEKVQSKHQGNKKVISYSHLRVEKLIENTVNTYRFDVLKNGNETITEKKIDKNDIFYMSTMGIFIAAVSTLARGKAVLQTYPNETVFTAVAGPPAFVPGDLEIIYNGTFNINVDAIDYIDGMDARQFRSVPTTQQSSASNKSQANYETGMVDVEPTFALSGGNDTKITLEVPINVSGAGAIAMAAQAANTENRLVFFTRGFLVKGGAKR